VAIHLTLGTITNDFCVQRNDIINLGASKALSAAENANLTQAVLGPLKKILTNPQLLLSCSGNETVFELYNISLWNDMGFANIIDGLLNGTSLPSFFPSNSSLDQGVQSLADQQQAMNNTLESYQYDLPYEYMQIIDFQQELKNMSDANGCPPTPPPSPPCDTCCHINNLNNSCNNLLDLYNQINVELNILLTDSSDLADLLNKIRNARRSIVDTLAQSLQFPDLSNTTASDILNTLGDCSWLGTFWQTIVGEALCQKISPALLWVGWSFAVVGLCFLFLTPIIVWSLNLGSNGML